MNRKYIPTVQAAANSSRVYAPTERASMCDIHHHLRVGALIWKAGLAVVVLAVTGRIKSSQQHIYSPGTPSSGGCVSVQKFTFSGSNHPPKEVFLPSFLHQMRAVK